MTRAALDEANGQQREQPKTNDHSHTVSMSAVQSLSASPERTHRHRQGPRAAARTKRGPINPCKEGRQLSMATAVWEPGECAQVAAAEDGVVRLAQRDRKALPLTARTRPRRRRNRRPVTLRTLPPDSRCGFWPIRDWVWAVRSWRDRPCPRLSACSSACPSHHPPRPPRPPQPRRQECCNTHSGNHQCEEAAQRQNSRASGCDKCRQQAVENSCRCKTKQDWYRFQPS